MSTIYDYVSSFRSYLNPFTYSNPFYSTNRSVHSIDLEKDYESHLVPQASNNIPVNSLDKCVIHNKQFIIDKLHLIEALNKMEEKRKKKL